MDRRVRVWPDEREPEPPSQTAELLEEIDRSLAADLRGPAERDEWSAMIAEVFDNRRPE